MPELVEITKPEYALKLTPKDAEILAALVDQAISWSDASEPLDVSFNYFDDLWDKLTAISGGANSDNTEGYGSIAAKVRKLIDKRHGTNGGNAF